MEGTIHNEIQQVFGEEEQYDPMDLHRAWVVGLVTMDELIYLQDTDLLIRLGSEEEGSHGNSADSGQVDEPRLSHDGRVA